MYKSGDVLQSDGPTVLLFGSLALSFNEAAFSKTRQIVRDNSQHDWILNVVSELPEWCKSVKTAYPELRTEKGLQQLEDLSDAFRANGVLQTAFPLPNTLLIPLTVISQITQYTQYLSHCNGVLDDDFSPFKSAKHDKQVAGLCTGLLTAIAISSSENQEQLKRYGAVAVRLGMLIGMAVDAQDEASEQGPSRSLSMGWNSPESYAEASRILDRHPEAYTSVNYDQSRATLTTAASGFSSLQRELKAAGLVAADMGLYGRFHAKCHETIFKSLMNWCDGHAAFQFPLASALLIPCRANSGGEYITSGSLHEHVLQSILLDPPQWYQTFETLRTGVLRDASAQVISFGPEKSVPPSMIRGLNSQVLDWSDIDIANGTSAAPSGEQRTSANDDIAVVGMSCKVAGAEDLEEFWDLLCAGKSQHREVPKERFEFEPVFRDVDAKRKWFCNLLADPDAFDHKFFKKSPRESASMDPQQRQILQVAYQAVEQSGYFRSQDPDKRVGCYLGVSGDDYEANIACHAPNAFSATGNLRGFIAGKVSHYFGWTGPGLVIDTACSSSAVAVHQACKAIASGECTAALAGGSQVLTDPLWFQNLAGASFLSTTGQCKPFDAKADGYCRGEGAGAVLLKKLSSALEDGDQIQGVIAATAVQQNENCTPIFVPNAPSLSDLFRNTTTQARLCPSQVSVVEAHGTGTAVGDPAEYSSIKQVFGGSIRPDTLHLSSVKGLVGHCEGTSGIISMIKILLMMQKGKVPPQASFDTINPAIKATEEDRITIPKALKEWDAKFKAALINNYGASGSNASMVLTQSPLAQVKTSTPNLSATSAPTKYPFWFSGIDDSSLRRYAKAMRGFLSPRKAAMSKHSLADISFNFARQSNRGLDRSLMFTVHSTAELENTLAAFEKGDHGVSSMSRPAQKPVVLCFGGQISTFVGLDGGIYENVTVFRNHLDKVDAVARRQGAKSIFPGIFQRSPFQDTVQLQVTLFAMQYACARSWIDSSIQPAAVVGHSFGELTALCVSKALSLEDALRMIINRASLVRDAWGDEKGAMMAVEAELVDVERLLARAGDVYDGEKPASIACYNGPRSYTVAGPSGAIDAVSQTLSEPSFGSIKGKRLNVTNAFHCALVDPLLGDLEHCIKDLKFHDAAIPMERASEQPSLEKINYRFVANHMRSPVYFHHAMQRLAKKFPSCVFLEAGSNSTITSMAGRALQNPSNSHFQAINITSDNAWKNLTDATLSLWKAGCSVQHWAHHASQTQEHAALLLPPYQFEKSHHWVELKTPPKFGAAPLPTTNKQEAEQLPDSLLTFVGYNDDETRLAKFRINTMIPQYEKIVSGHLFVNTAPICPATVQLDFVIEAVRNLRPQLAEAKFEPQVHDVKNQSPVCVNPARALWIELQETSESKGPVWTFEVYSTESQDTLSKMTHTTGQIIFRSTEDLATHLEFARFERFISHKRCVELLQGGEDEDDALQGRNIYRTFAEVVDYGKQYQGVKKVVGRRDVCAGLVVKQYNPETWLDAYLADCFCQVGGIYVNCMTDRSSTDMFIANAIEQYVRSPKLRQGDARPEAFHVFATHHRVSDKQFLTDVFAFNAATGTLLEAIIGLSYVAVPKISMSKMLSRLTADGDHTAASNIAAPSAPVKIQDAAAALTSKPERPQIATSNQASEQSKPPKAAKTAVAVEQRPKVDVTPKVKAILVELSGLEEEDIKADSQLADLGIDSLMGMELAHEIEKTFNISIPDNELMEVVDMPSLLKCVQSKVGGDTNTSVDIAEDTDDDDSVDQEKSYAPSVFTPATAEGSADTTDDESENISSMNEVKKPRQNAGLTLSPNIIMSAFNETKHSTDERIIEYGQTRYAKQILPEQTRMCIALTLEAFEQLGCSLRNAKANQQLTRIPHAPEQIRFVDHLYKLLAKEADLINIDGDSITRTGTPYPSQSSKELLDDLLARNPDQNNTDKLTYYVGSQLAEVLSGKVDGVKLIFGTPEGRDLVGAFYGDWPLNRVMFNQMENFLGRLVSKLGTTDGPLKILEMGSGTGGTTKWLVPLLAKMDVPVEYTFSDLAPSLVAAARKRFKDYKFMKFRTHDIEKVPADDLMGTQHIVVASNAIHATHSLGASTENVRKALRPDGFLMMMEMTRQPYWVDIVFGVFEGWWFFDDGRTHALTHESRWETDLQSVGFGHVDWTDGNCPENEIQRLIIALASGPKYERELPRPLSEKSERTPSDNIARQATVDSFVQEMTDGWSLGLETEKSHTGLRQNSPKGRCILITGGTGSLGSHLLEKFASMPDVRRVICLNRRGKIDPIERQQQALTKRGISLLSTCADKLRVLETDMAKPGLGLSENDYQSLLMDVTDIVHNAWLMSIKWPLRNFKPQLQMMRNLLDLARDISIRRPSGAKVSFEFISSIATVGHWPLQTGKADVPEERMPIDAVLPIGYGEAKYICELMLDKTLHRYTDRFRCMAVRVGQIAGSSTSGYWNPMEHLSFIIKSSQTLQVLPDFDGVLSWTPVDKVADTLADIVTLPEETRPYPIYHIDNPNHQPWKEMIPMLADALEIPREDGIVPFSEWVQRVRDHPRQVEGPEGENPAIMLIDFLDNDFMRMSCGGLLLETKKSQEHSKTLANLGPVSEDLTRLFVNSWKKTGFLA